MSLHTCYQYHQAMEANMLSTTTKPQVRMQWNNGKLLDTEIQRWRDTQIPRYKGTKMLRYWNTILERYREDKIVSYQETEIVWCRDIYEILG